jgi:outer membrane protein TolC
MFEITPKAPAAKELSLRRKQDGWKRTVSLAEVLGVASICGLLEGCTAPDIYHRVSEEVRAEARSQAQPKRPEATDRRETLESVLAEVVRRDHGYRLAVGDRQLAAVQLTEAKRQVLPRLIGQGLLEVPIRESGTDTFLSGGLYLQFDLMRAFFSRNAITVAEITQETKRNKCRASAATACLTFFNTVTRLEGVLRAMAHSRAAEAHATQAAAEAETMFKSGRAPVDRWQAWTWRREDKTLEQQRLAARLQKAQLELAQCCGVTNHEMLLQLEETFLKRLTTPGETGGINLAEKLEKAPRVDAAKLELFLAEVQVLEARLKRLPTIAVGLNYGQIPVEGDQYQIEEGIVPTLSMSMPILDMGDISRAIQRARIRAKQARDSMVQAVEASRLELESTKQNLVLAQAALRAAEARRNSAAERRAQVKTMLETGKASALDAHEAAWVLNETEGLLDQAREEYRLALLAERSARGELLDDTLQKEILLRSELDH